VLDAPINAVQTVKATHAAVDEPVWGLAEQMASTLWGTGAVVRFFPGYGH